MKKLKLLELGRVSLEDYDTVPKIPMIIVCDNIRSAMNVGSIFRTADAMALECIYLCGISATPPNREITKTAIGAEESVTWKYFEHTADAIQDLLDQDYEVVGIEQTSESIELMQYRPSKKKLAIVLGNEVKGVSNEALPLLSGAIEIAQYGTKHSLNVSVCGGIVMHHFAEMMR